MKLTAVLALFALAAGCGDDGRTLREADGVPNGSGQLVSTTSTTSTSLVGGPTTTLDVERERAAALAAWDAYKKAVLAKDGTAAGRVVTEGTFAQYGTAVDRALTENRTHLGREDVLDVVMVLTIRRDFTAEELAGVDGRRFFELAVDTGTVDAATVRGVVFDGADVDPGGLEAQLTTSKSDQAIRGMLMRKEGDGWKVDVGEYTTQVDRQITRAASDQGKTPLEAAFELLGIAPDSEEAERLLTPLKEA